MQSQSRKTLIALVASLACAAPVWAAVGADEAATLKTELTPLGGEKAANKDGSIPAWTGGFTGKIAGEKEGGRRGDPFKAEKPLYSVTAKNMAQYTDKLSDGVKALLKKYPDSYRLDVYPTHRTAMAPQWVYDNTAKNAVTAKMNGDVPTGAYGGIPFPIPKNGLEAMWNHKLAWRGESWEADLNQYQLTSDGKVVLTTDGLIRQRMPYYFKEETGANYDGVFWEVNLTNSGPPIRAGEMIVGRQNLDEDKSASYVYLTGQRRVRKLPNACCDTPTPATAGLMSFDELSVFSGTTSRFNWKLAGKKEMLIPYNNNRILQVKDSDLVKPYHLNPDHVRWELHRVWVVEATLKDGQRHQAPKSTYYLDEDTWVAALGDRWDAKGDLWKTLWLFNYVMPDAPGTVQQTMGFYDVQTGNAYVANVLNDKPFHHRFTKRWPTDTFTGQGLASQGVR
ncbi:hypothetical protein LPB72_13725 [Hydrogenophaga crassostreae]|uniref:Outer membrane lipoprotein-sorting protein n=1 Tax=Hydrogenophaga crassostreae TaxID=1763535 RepID=A0A162YYZ8_9BURK|nr:DUF1329 domain-containing protein [Hydrogenophaga crassostreae]AOW15340.1 hypothetical protein LPB072_03485 [Hydrogenophaga crassostreae]OAD41297.1 hypothetical protein LPB72_13725 [Hydrogenophaga crassostreae]